MSNLTEADVLSMTVNSNRLYVLKQKAALYYQLTKPGIVIANVMTAIAGYIFASRWHIHVLSLASLAAGTALIIASACVWNNYIDRDIDKLMTRTSRRAIPTGKILSWKAWLYACTLGVTGFSALAFTNRITIALGAAALFSYVILYGIAKRRTEYGTIIGTLPGAASLLAGYTAVTGRLDVAAMLLFIIMFTWQIPHFYAIAVRRLTEYSAVKLPVWPVKRGIASTKRQISLFIALFMSACILLTVLGYAGITFLLVMSSVGLRWLQLSLQGFTAADSSKWAKRTFLFSLVTLLVLSIMLPLGAILP